MLSMFDHTSVTIRKMLNLRHVAPNRWHCLASPVYPTTLFYLFCYKAIAVFFCFVEVDLEVPLAFSLYKPLSLHVAASVVWLLMYAQGSLVSKYTMHGLRRIFCTIMVTLILFKKNIIFNLKMIQLGKDDIIGV